MAGGIWSAMRTTKRWLPIFALYQIFSMLMISPWLSSQRQNTEILEDIIVQSPPLSGQSASRPVNLDWNDGCQRRTFTAADYSPDSTLGANEASVQLFYPPPIPLKHFDLSIHGEDMSASIGIKPSFGSHNCTHDAVLSFVYGYQLPQIIFFVTTLLDSGFCGDLVLGIGNNLTVETRQFLHQLATKEEKVNVVVYQVSLTCVEGKSYQFCQADELYQDGRSNEWIPDERSLRRVATLRFEYYWAWSSMYSSDSLLFLTDARDVYFQSNPIPSDNRLHSMTSNVATTLFLFEEAATIEQSTPNRNWLKRTYSDDVMQKIKDRPVICSGTTLGGQPAMETYTRGHDSRI